MAACSVMPVNSVFLIKIDCGSEVSYCFIVLQEPIPDKTTTIVSWCILWIKLNDSIEILKSKFKPIPAYLLSYCTQVVYCLHIILLELNCSQVIFFSLSQMICLIPTESSIIVCLKVILV